MRDHQGRIAGLDGIRAIAAVIVFAGHAPTWHYLNGGAGVAAFFFLSGYLITTLLRRERDGTGRVSLLWFYVRRTIRIVPPMLVAVALAVALISAGLVDDPYTWTGLLQSLTFTSNFALYADYPAGHLINTLPLWSLCIEEHFYLLFPGLFVLAGLRGRGPRGQAVVLLGVIAALTAWKAWLMLFAGVDGWRIYLGSDTSFDMILFGCVFALVANPAAGDRPLPAWVVRCWPLALTVFVLAAQYGKHPLLGLLRTPVEACALAVIFTAIATRPRVATALEWRSLRWLGTVSYTFYLVHVLVIHVLEGVLGGAPAAVVTSSAFAGSVLVAWTTRVWIELPCQRAAAALRHLADRRRAVVAADQTVTRALTSP